MAKKAKKTTKKAKKTVKKTVKKVSKKKKIKRKKTTKKKPPQSIQSANYYRMLLDHKRMMVKELVPDVPVSGTDEIGGESIPYTNAEEVRQLYFDAFEKVGLTVSPIAQPGMMPIVSIEGRFFACAGAFRITDLDTGYSEVSWGAGLGSNDDWAGNTAQTRAMKQFLLMSFHGQWRDPNQSQMRKVRQEVLNSDLSELAEVSGKKAVEAIENFFENQLKEKN